ncbi:MAG: 5-(carboxyamino)imidazole ribonucleotide mutase [Candidatus Hodarchaeota archaeon]
MSEVDVKKSDILISVIAGSKNKTDREVLKQVTDVLDEFEVPYETKILSAHRTPYLLENYVNSSPAQVFIAIAGLSAALPGVIASKTIKPTIGVPINVKLGGLDSLLSIVQMPPGISVGTVGIDNGTNAAILAIQILAIYHEELTDKLKSYREQKKKKYE